jgi:hypothetical protein
MEAAWVKAGRRPTGGRRASDGGVERGVAPAWAPSPPRPHVRAGRPAAAARMGEGGGP